MVRAFAGDSTMTRRLGTAGHDRPHRGRRRRAGAPPPAAGGYVLACNHVSNLDPWPLGLPLWPRRWLRFMAKAELYWWPARYVLDGAGAFPVHRGLGDREAIETAVRVPPGGEGGVVCPGGAARG